MTLLFESPSSVLAAAAVSIVSLVSGRISLVVLSVAIWIFLAIFFRDFDGPVDDDPLSLVSPGEGLLMFARETEHSIHLGIRLALWDRHVQIAPAEGTVISQAHQPGEFNSALFFEKTELNERTDTTLMSPVWGRITVVQIAGQIANRIQSFVSVGDVVKRGAKIGLIKFGSRVDLIVPKNPGWVYLLACQPGDHVQLGQPLLRLLV